MLHVDVTHAKQDNGTIFIFCYELKKPRLFVEAKIRDFGDPTLKTIVLGPGTYVTVSIMKTLSGNYASFKARKDNTLYEYDCNAEEVDWLITNIYDKQFN